MTITFRIPASSAELVGFSYSPSMEAVLSLHVLVEPKHHPVQHAWVRAMRRLSPALKREIDVFSFAFRSYFPEFFFPPPTGELLGFEDELQPRSTQELAPLVGITEAGLSKQLRLLNEAGLVERRREGYYVLYRLIPEQVAALAPSLQAFLHASDPTD